MNATSDHIGNTKEKRMILEWLKEIPDPEIPVLSIVDLGMIREIHPGKNEEGKNKVEVVVTPTYSGCPALEMIRIQIRVFLQQKGYEVKISETLSPPWTTDWMSEEGRKKLCEYGIAPPNPVRASCELGLFEKEEAVACPHCHSHHTHRVSAFGSTPCKSLYQCDDCLEPFDYFKCH